VKKKYVYSDEHCPAELVTEKLRAVNPVVLDILYKRGIRTPAEMEEFLFPSLSASIRRHPPLLDMEKAVALLSAAVKEKLPVGIYHDYDVDGITAGAVVKRALEPLGVPVGLYCNDRIHGGFGINAAGVDELLARYPDTKVLMTVDNGITGVEGVARAKERGLSVIVTDHHEPNDVLPAADAVIDHKRKDEPETQDKNCCGAGVAWKVMLNLYIRLGRDVTPVMDLLDIAALGTIADVVPLRGDNRAIVQEGLRLINEEKRPFFRMFKEVMELQSVDSQTIAFKLAPMINAVSRMGYDTEPAVELLLSNDEEQLRTGIVRMSDINEERKAETAREVKAAVDAVKDADVRAIVYRDESFQEGIVGIVAGQLKEEYGVPCIVLTKAADGNWKGSCRSPEGFPMKEALDKCAEFLTSYGGHAKAAGVTVRASDYEAFKARIEELAAERAKAGDIQETATIDVVLPASAFTEEVVRELRILEPYGEGFPTLLFGLTATVVDTRYMGSEQQHVKYIDDTGLSIIRWNGGESAKARPAPPRKFVGYPSLNSWNGTVSVQFIAS